MPLRRLIVLSSLALGVAVLTPAAGLAAANGTDRPLSGKATSTTVIVFGNPSAVTNDGSGQLSHLGSYTFHFHGTMSAATGTLVAANGDQLFVTATGGSTTITDGTIHSTASNTIVGGTGRFAGATGTYTFTSDSVITAFTGSSLTTSDTDTIEGHISY
jgi:hypothetical protein